MTEQERQAALDWFKSHYCQSECAHYKTVVAALQLPRVPVIEGLDEAITHFIKFWGEDKVRQDENILFKAARAYAELQKGC